MTVASRRALARLGAGIGAVVAVVATAAPAWAASGRIDGYTIDGSTLRISFSAVGLAPGETIDLGSVVTTVGGESLDSKASPATTTNTPERSTMLTIDLSGSMATPLPGGGTRISAAKQAAQAYLDGVPKDVKVGLVTFSNAPSVVIRPTTDHAAVSAAVAKLTFVQGGSTALYAGVIEANKTLGTTGLRNQLLLSDGANEDPGGPTLQDAVKSTVTTRTTVDAVSVGADSTGKSQLDAISAAGKGVTVTAASADALTAYFKAAAETQANQIVVDVAVPAAFAGTSKNVVVTAKAGGETITGATVAQFPSGGGASPSQSTDYGPIPVPAPEPGITAQPWFLPLAIGLLGVGLFVVLAFAFLATDRNNMQTGRVSRRLSRYSLSSRDTKASAPATSGALGQSAVARSAAEFAGRVAQRTDVDTGLALKLDAAGLPLKPGEWMIIHIGIAVLAALVTALLTGFGWLAVVLVFIVGLIGPWLYLSIKQDRRKTEFGEQLPETLQLMAGSLAAGYSLPQAIDTVVRESEGPMAAELNRALVEARLGVPVEDALEATAIRMGSVDFQWVVMALRIQREVGGNLAEVLTNVATTMRERARLRRQVSVLSAEGRLSAIILGALPVVFVIYLALVRPEYLGLLITTPLGILMIVVGLALLIGGAFWLRSVVKVEV